MTTYKPGDIVLTPFPFADLHTLKQRPALVLLSVASKIIPELVLLSMITSQVESESLSGDCLIQDWKKSGLIYPSKIRLAKCVSLEKNIILKKLGSLTNTDKTKVHSHLKKLWGHWKL